MNQLIEMVVFARVVESRGFTAAARQLGITTSAVSRSVARLEAHMGGRLLHRSTRALSVTELGREVYSGCARIANTAREMEAFAGHYASTATGRLQVSAPVTYGQVCVAPQLSEFMKSWPQVDIHLDLSDRAVDVVGGNFDLVISTASTLPAGLVARPLDTVSHVLVATPEYLSKIGSPLDPFELGQHACVYLAEAACRSEIALHRGGEKIAVPVQSRLTINDSGAVIAAICAGVGFGLVPDYAAKEAIHKGMLTRIFPDWSPGDPHHDRTVHAIYSPTRHLPRKVRAFIDFLVSKGDRGDVDVALDETVAV